MPPQTTDPPFHQTRASVLLDAVRGIAALFVTVQHLRSIFFLPFQQLTRHRALLHLPYLLASVGYQAVILFFVLSGFLVGGTTLRSLERGDWSWRRYLTQRFVRLWIVLLPALLLGFAWDHATLLHGLSPTASHQAQLLGGDLAPRLNLRTFFGNLAFLQEIVVLHFGSNGPLWSLANEAWYYLLFPLSLTALYPGPRPLGSRLASALVFIFIAVLVGRAILVLFPIWILGALLHYAPPPPRLSPRFRYVTLALCPPALLLAANLSYRHPTSCEYVLGLFTAVLIWILLSDRRAADPATLVTRSSRTLASFSYTLYLVHLPAYTFAGCLLLGNTRWVPTVPHLALAALLWFAVLLYAWCVAFLTEFRTNSVRRSIEAAAASLFARQAHHVTSRT